MTSRWDRLGILLWRTAEVVAAAIYEAARAVEAMRQLRHVWIAAVTSEVARRRAARRSGYRLTSN